MKKSLLLAGLAAVLVFQTPAHVEDQWRAGLDKVRHVADIIEADYVKSVDKQDLAESSIRGVLDTLDPHSYFLDPEGFSRMREDYSGRYFGVGLQIQKIGDNLTVVSPIEGGPSWRLGVQPGDIIAKINGESTVPMSAYDALQKLRGENNTKVELKMTRDGLDKPFDLTVIREEIPLLSIPYVFMLSKDTGYVYIRNFAENTPEELEAALEKLTKQGMKDLILDLRLNPGGPLVQCIQVSDLFLPKDSLIVSMKGRNPVYDREFRAMRDGQYEKLPLVILIDQGSASASEIVSGAIMDHDRGLVVGEDSWGKGLVQTVFPLAPDMAVALTVAKYLTPSGRSIQRDYTHIDDYMLSKKAPEESREVKYTDNGRKVLGQGGITPDYKVDSLLLPVTARLRFRGAFFNYARRLFHHQTELGAKMVFPGEQTAGKTPKDRIVVARPFTTGPEVMADFSKFLKTQPGTYEEKDLAAASEEIRRELEREITAAIWGFEESVRVSRLSDTAVKKAIEVMPEAASYVAKMTAAAQAKQ